MNVWKNFMMMIFLVGVVLKIVSQKQYQHISFSKHLSPRFLGLLIQIITFDKMYDIC